MPKESEENFNYLNIIKASHDQASDQTRCYPYLDISLDVVSNKTWDGKQGVILEKRDVV